MAGIHNYEWAQGEDLVMSLIYKQGPEGEEAPLDLTGYSLRMDIALPSGERIYTFNSAEVEDVEPDETTAVPDTNLEVTLGSAGEINITVPRSVTLPGGEAWEPLMTEPPTLIYDYDVFLRNPDNKQIKILKGQISIERSVTLWQ